MSAPGRYDEPGRGFGSLWIVLALLAVGFGVDAAFGGAVTHLPGWIVAAVLLIGADLLVVHSARATRSLSITGDEVRVGDEAIARADIVGARLGPDRDLPVLGWDSGLPRGVQAVRVRLSDEREVVVPTRFPQRVLAALAVADPGDVDLPARTADDADRALVEEIDTRAEAVFTVAGLALPQGPFPPPRHDPAPERALFVVGRPAVGYVRIDEVDGLAHLAELAVVPGSMRRGLGGRLLEHACDWASGQGYAAITLTTYADVAWNGPFYARRGFVEVTEPTPGLVRIREREAEIGLDAVGRRVVMRRELR